MIDFTNASFVKMRKVDGKAFAPIVAPILIPEETVVGYYQAMRDGVVFTTKRIISINVQGVTGKKKDLTSLPYCKIQAYSVEAPVHLIWTVNLICGFPVLARSVLSLPAIPILAPFAS